MRDRQLMLLCRLLRRVTRVLYKFNGTGLPRVAELIRRSVAKIAHRKSALSRLVIDDFRGRSKFICDLGEHIGSQLFFRGQYSEAELDTLERILKKEFVFVDIGANQGVFTVCAAGMLTEGKVYAFEPVSHLRKRLEENLQVNNYGNVIIFDCGLSDISGQKVPIFESDTLFDDGTNNAGLPSLFREGPGYRTIEEILLLRLDDFTEQIGPVDVIKIDVEGAELAVLRGGESTISKYKPYIIFEANASALRAAGENIDTLFAYLIEMGYRLNIIGERGQLSAVTDGDLGFANVLASHPERSRRVS
ncbi:FkbM family methyltransferase [Chelativorans sp. SCAU2101]|uniref:FkbM family methyltransferase n=1 Tax=Chelativorans petroleitrophicus TaxID=2975484 RepID=A0A9X3B0P9_9HYPH|nr:FkbM family methyltransferase [Chelativorans petroleitrophicus]MCT8992270.1 FkbM family methyltransferase [Chelativorans petroleitrophicus]